MKTKVIGKLTSKLGRAGLKLKKHSPEVLIVAGIVGTVTSAVMACRATTKISGILDETKEQIDAVHDYESGKKKAKVGYSKEDGKKDLTIIYVQTGLKLAKLYAPSVLLGTLSITGIVGSNVILRKRCTAFAAAYTALDTSFKRYRKNVTDRFGKDVDNELIHNKPAVSDTGEGGDEAKPEVNTGRREHSDYARIFDDGCTGWKKDPEYNLMFLRMQESYFNDLLKARGHVFLNEVYDALGIPRSKVGQVVGWIYDEKNTEGDNYIDFGIYDERNAKAREFVNGYEPTIWLDFNVDGIIYDLI